MRKIIGLIALIYILFTSCQGVKQVSTQNISHIYKISSNYLNPEYTVYHSSDTISKLYYKVHLNQLLYIKPVNTDTFRANFKIAYQLLSSYESRIIIDSNTVFLSESKSYKKNKSIIGSININARIKNEYILKVFLTDINRKKTVIRFVDIDKSGRNTRQNFKLLSEKDLPYFTNIVDQNDKFYIFHNNPNVNQLTCYYYNRSFPISSPPHEEVKVESFNFKPDSIFTIDLHDGQTELLKLLKKGIYHFLTDTNETVGFSLFYFSENYPAISSIDQMIASVRYLTTNKEFKTIMMAKNKKDELDNFWIKNAGNPDRAKEMIRRYYNRVQDANRFFPSYIDGWKTDRGMIYIVYGRPNIVYRTSDYERWVYGEGGHILSVSLTFYKINNPFTSNDYSLERSAVYKDSWFNAIDIWRR